MVEKGMRERYATTARETGRRIGSALLSASLLFNAETSVAIDAPRASAKFGYEATELQTHAESMQQLLSGNLATVIRNPETGLPFIVSDHLPADKAEGFRDALAEPLVRLSLAKNATAAIYVSQDSSENGFFSFYDSSETLLVNASVPESGGMLGNPAMLAFALDHESTHALNSQWWQMLYNHRFSDDMTLRKKIVRVAETCAAINKDVLHTFIDADRNQLADTFETAGGPDIPDDIVTILFEKHGHAEYRASMRAAASAIRKGDEDVYDAPRRSDIACQSPQLLSIPETIAHHSLELPSDLPLTAAVELLQTQQNLGAAAKRAFVCLREGPGLSELLKDIRPLAAGHPQDNPTEAASSLVTSLLSNPPYMERCLGNMEPEERQLVEDYMSALIDLMHYTHPEIIQVLREDPKAAAIIDRLWQPAA